MHGFSNIFIFSDATDINGGAPQYIVSTKGDEVKAITQTIAWRNRVLRLIFFLMIRISLASVSPLPNERNAHSIRW